MSHPHVLASARRFVQFLSVGALAALLSGCLAGPGESTSSTTGETTVGLVTDYGDCSASEHQIAELVTSWEPLAIVSAGDNSQIRDGGCAAFTQSVNDSYGDWVAEQTFWPALGNHDYDDESAGLPNYLRYFDYLPTDADPESRWYSKTLGNITFYVIDSNQTGGDLEPQRQWLKESLRANRAGSAWQIVVMHHPPYTTGTHDIGTDERPDLRPADTKGFNYAAWGADLVVAGHMHVYEDVVRDGFHYLTAGTGSADRARECRAERTKGSRVCLEGAGAVRIMADTQQLVLEYHQPIDEPGKGIRSEVTDTITLTH